MGGAYTCWIDRTRSPCRTGLWVPSNWSTELPECSWTDGPLLFRVAGGECTPSPRRIEILIIESIFIGPYYANSGEQMLSSKSNGDLMTRSIVSCGIRSPPLARVMYGPCMVSGPTSPSKCLSIPSAPIDTFPFHSCDGTFGQSCDPSREENDITGVLTSHGQTSLLSFMQTHWKDNKGDDNSFWSHEWNKHGTCMRCAEATYFPLAIYLTPPPIAQTVSIASRTLSRLSLTTLPQL